MAYRNHYENLTSELQKLCYLSDTTLRNAKPHSLVPCGGWFILWPFPPPLLDDGQKEKP